MKYLVVETQYSYAIVLDEQGRFLKTANRNYEVGQFVEDVVEMQDDPQLELPAPTPSARKRRPVLAGLAAAACLAIAAIGFSLMGATPYASVYLTINPEVRIDVNKHDHVIDLEGVNGDGAALIEGYDHERKLLDDVVDDLVDRAIDAGYLHEGGAIAVSLDGKSDEWVTSTGARLESHLAERLDDSVTIVIDVDGAGPGNAGQSNYGDSDYGEERPAAASEGLSVTIPTGDSDYDEDDGDSGYGDDDGDSPHQGSANAGASASSDDSGYGASSYGNDDYGEDASEYGEVDDSFDDDDDADDDADDDVSDYAEDSDDEPDGDFDD